MIFFSIKKFDFQANKLTKKVKDGYKNLLHDITTFFENKNISEIFETKTTLEFIDSSHNIALKKVRIPNSNQKLSSRDGYRLIFIINKEKETVYLLYVYPKTGKYGQIDIKPNETSIFTQNLLSAIEQNNLSPRNLSKKLLIEE